MKKCNQIQQFIENRIKQTRQQSKQSTDPMEKLKLAVTQVSFAHVLSQYLETNKYMFEALLHLSKVYILNQTYNEALIQARLARKEAENSKDGSKERATLLIAQCMVRQRKFEDAHQILHQLELPRHADDCKQNLYQLLLEVQIQLNEEEKSYSTLEKLEEVIKEKQGQKSVQYGFLLVKRGKTAGNFGKYRQAINDIGQGVDILIEKKCKQKKRIAEIYLTMAEYYKKLNNLQKQYSSLICAHSMAKQIEDSQKQVLPIIHMLASNLIERQQYSKALKQLKIAKNMEKQMYGESSAQIGRTVKKITQILSKLNMKSEVKKYEQQYSRIIGPGSSTLKEKTINHQKPICI